MIRNNKLCVECCSLFMLASWCLLASCGKFKEASDKLRAELESHWASLDFTCPDDSLRIGVNSVYVGNGVVSVNDSIGFDVRDFQYPDQSSILIPVIQAIDSISKRPGDRTMTLYFADGRTPLTAHGRFDCELYESPKS